MNDGGNAIVDINLGGAEKGGEMENPVTDTHVGLKPDDDKFRDSRNKKMNNSSERKARRDRAEYVPRFQAGDEIVITSGWKGRHYIAVRILDSHIRPQRRETIYYGTITKTTDKAYKDRIGKMIHFVDGGYLLNHFPANVPVDSIKWGEENGS